MAKQPIPVDLRAALDEIERWRDTRRKVGPVPQPIWGRAVELAGRYGLPRVARLMKLNYSGLRKRVAARQSASAGAPSAQPSARSPAKPAPARSSAQPSAPAFVELWPGVSAPVVTLVRSDGARLVIEGGHLDLQVLAESFCGQRS